MKQQALLAYAFGVWMAGSLSLQAASHDFEYSYDFEPEFFQFLADRGFQEKAHLTDFFGGAHVYEETLANGDSVRILTNLRLGPLGQIFGETTVNYTGASFQFTGSGTVLGKADLSTWPELDRKKIQLRLLAAGLASGVDRKGIQFERVPGTIAVQTRFQIRGNENPALIPLASTSRVQLQGRSSVRLPRFLPTLRWNPASKTDQSWRLWVRANRGDAQPDGTDDLFGEAWIRTAAGQWLPYQLGGYMEENHSGQSLYFVLVGSGSSNANEFLQMWLSSPDGSSPPDPYYANGTVLGNRIHYNLQR